MSFNNSIDDLLVVDVGITAEWIGEVGDEASFEVDGWLFHESPFVKRAFASAGKERSDCLLCQGRAVGRVRERVVLPRTPLMREAGR